MAHNRKKSDTDPSSPNKAISPQYQNSSPGSSWPPAPPETGSHSHLPGEGEDSNAFRKLHPKVLLPMYRACQDPEKKYKIWRALKEWSRQYTDSLINPYKYEKYFVDIKDDYNNPKEARAVASILKRAAESVYPAQNLFYYQEGEGTQFPDAEHGNMVNYHGDPTVDQRKMFVYPRDYDQNADTEHLEQDINTDTGDFQAPTEDPLVNDLRTNRGGPLHTSDERENVRSGGVKVSNFFDTFVWASDESLDVLFKSKKASRKKVSRIVKLSDLQDFIKVGNDLLVHKSKQDLWAMEQDEEGNIIISRLFDGDLIK